MNLQSKFGYCMTTQTLNIALCKRDGFTDKQTDGGTDVPNTRCPRQTFQAGGIKSQVLIPIKKFPLFFWQYSWRNSKQSFI